MWDKKMIDIYSKDIKSEDIDKIEEIVEIMKITYDNLSSLYNMSFLSEETLKKFKIISTTFIDYVGNNNIFMENKYIHLLFDMGIFNGILHTLKREDKINKESINELDKIYKRWK